MTNWKVVVNFVNNPKTEEEIQLFDVSSYFKGYLKLKRSYFNELEKIVRTSKSYFAQKAIASVTNPEGEDWTANAWMLLVLVDTEMGTPFRFLIKRERDLSGTLVGVGPEVYVSHNEDIGNADTKREIMRIFNYIIVYFNKFNCSILLPTQLTEQLKSN
ncbi:MAG: hypothetical protein GF353_26895 [Candidatus Lokiarchaeota archaeon]|nr:hypothetical protein [Candidatus Lokiarchaeota archaeon]